MYGTKNLKFCDYWIFNFFCECLTKFVNVSSIVWRTSHFFFLWSSDKIWHFFAWSLDEIHDFFCLIVLWTSQFFSCNNVTKFVLFAVILWWNLIFFPWLFDEIRDYFLCPQDEIHNMFPETKNNSLKFKKKYLRNSINSWKNHMAGKRFKSGEKLWGEKREYSTVFFVIQDVLILCLICAIPHAISYPEDPGGICTVYCSNIVVLAPFTFLSDNWKIMLLIYTFFIQNTHQNFCIGILVLFNHGLVLFNHGLLFYLIMDCLLLIKQRLLNRNSDKYFE